MLQPFRFRLATMFLAVSVIACTLAAWQHLHRVPIRTGTMSHAICYAKDFEKLVSSRPGQQAGDFAMHIFDAASPAELFCDFSPMPKIWAEKRISEIAGYDRRSTPTAFPYSYFQLRLVDDPVGELKGRWGLNNTVYDHLELGGVFEESAIPPKRYTIECVLRLTLGALNHLNASPAATTIADMIETVRSKQPSPPTVQPIQSRLRYTGPAHRGLLVFSRLIDDELVQLVILDLRP